MKYSILSLLFSILYSGLYAQDTSFIRPKYKSQHYFDLAGSVGNKEIAGALSWSHLHGFGKKKQKFKVGYGLRFTSYVGANQSYSTAPSKYTSTKQNLGTILSETINENLDTIALQTPQVNLINLSVYLQYTIKRFDLGFNVDVTGFSFGSDKKINIISSQYDPNQSPVQTARPTKFNLLLTSDNDIGSLNSEFSLRYWISKKIAIRSGLTFLFTEYTSAQKHSFDNGRIMNDRYRLKSSLFMVGITYKPFK